MAAVPAIMASWAGAIRDCLVTVRHLAAAALICAIAGCTAGKPGTTFVTYPVAGDSYEAFVRSVHAAAPRGGRAYGLTEITFHPVYSLAAGEKGCVTEKVSVGMEIVVRLPAWRKGKAVTGSVAGRWRRFERLIRAHEMTHVAIAKNYGKRLETTIARLRSKSGCGDLRRRVADEIRKTKQAHLAAHAAFDRREQRMLNTLLPRR